mmetsp:Transcript_128266/g.357013  ORF Transcript_128266/g.357013 Transcript_128266/m.357013 type:complete len:91 (+) Transcript_128266:689-961(+)
MTGPGTDGLGPPSGKLDLLRIPSGDLLVCFGYALAENDAKFLAWELLLACRFGSLVDEATILSMLFLMPSSKFCFKHSAKFEPSLVEASS